MADLSAVKAMLRAVLMSQKEGVVVRKLIGDYRGMTGDILPFKQLGHHSLEDFLESIPDVVQIRRDKTGEYVAHAIADEKTAHIKKLISNQKTKKRKPGKFSKYPSRKPMPSPWKSNRYGGPPQRNVNRQPIPPRPSQSNYVSWPHPCERSSWKREEPRPSQQPKYVPPRFQKQYPPRPAAVPSPKQQSTLNYKSMIHEYCQKKGHQVFFTTCSYDKREGSYVSSLKIDGQMFGSISPKKTRKEAEFLAAEKACEHLRITQDSLNKMQTAKKRLSDKLGFDMNTMDVSSDVDDVVKSRVQKLVGKRQNGLWASRLRVEYKEMFNEELPPNIEEIMEKWSDTIRVERVTGTNMSILYPISPPETSSESYRDENGVIPDPVLPEIGSHKTVYSAYVENCHEFYVQLDNSPIDKIMSDISAIYNKSDRCPPNVPSFTRGGYCIAQYSEDENWYRGRMVSTKTNGKFQTEVEVFYVDFGNSEYKTSVKYIKSSVCKHPAQAIRCSLYGVLPKEGGWGRDCINEFQKTMNEGPMIMEVIAINDNCCDVNIWRNDILYNEDLVKRGLVKMKVSEPEALKIPESDFLDVYVSYLTKATEVVVRIISDQFSGELEKMEDEMKSYYTNKPTVKDVSVGSLYAVYIKDDDCYCRVRVISHDDKQAECLFLDHGGVEALDINRLHILHHPYRKLPYQAITCSLGGLEEYDQNDEVIENLIDLAHGNTCVAQVIDRTDVLSVILFDTSSDVDININELIIDKIKDNALSPPVPKEGRSLFYIYVSHVSDGGMVYVQVPGVGIDRLEQLMEQINDHYSTSKNPSEMVPDPKEGQLVCTRYTDGRWYRAEITRVLSDCKVEVFYVDYGDSSIVDITTLREPVSPIIHLRTLPWQAVECVVYGLPPSEGYWTEAAVKRLSELVMNDRVIAAKVANQATDTDPLELSLYPDDCSVTQILLDEVHLFFQDSSEADSTEQEVSLLTKLDAISLDQSNVTPSKDINQTSGTSPLYVTLDQIGHLSNTLFKNTEITGSTPSRKDIKATLDFPVSPMNNNTLLAEQSQQSDLDNSVEVISMNWNTKKADQSVEVIGVSHSGSGEPYPSSQRAVTSNRMPKWVKTPDKGQFMDVFVMWTSSPSNFTCIPYNNHEELTVLMAEMLNLYQDKPAHLETDIVQKDQLYAIHHNGCWYRGLVNKLLPANKVSCMFVDVGDYHAVLTSDIYQLPDQFRQMEFQAIKAQLAGIQPVPQTWTRECEERFAMLVLEKAFVAFISEKEGDKIIINLIDTTDEDVDDCVNEKLILEGHAEPL